MVSPAIPILLFFGLAFAGCVEGPEAAAPLGEPVASDGSTLGNATSSDPGARPAWTHGDWFEFEVVFDNTYVQFETRDRVVVNRADETGYELGAGNRDLGVIDAHFDDFFVGQLDADLNAVRGTEAAQYRMFDWPRAAGKAWEAGTALPRCRAPR